MTIVGSAEVEVNPLTTGFGEKTEAAVKRALAGIEGQVNISADTTGLRERVEATLAGMNAELDIDIDLLSIRRRIEFALSGLRADIDLDIDTLGARQRIEAGLAGISTKVNVGVDRDPLVRAASETGDAAAEALTRRLDRVKGQLFKLDNKAARASIEGSLQDIKNIRAEVGIDVVPKVDQNRVRRSVDKAVSGAIPGGGGIRTLLAGLALPALDASVSGLASLTGGLLSASSAALSAASSLGSVGAAALSLPSAFLAGAQGALVLASALSGIGGALKAYTAQQKAAGVASAGGGAAAGSSARAIEAAERAITRANRNLTEAYDDAAFASENSARRQEEAAQGLADAIEEATRRQKDAQERLRRAEVSLGDAQDELTSSRAKAREEVDDLRRSVERLALSEERATARVAELKAKRSLAERRAQQDLTGVTESTLRALERQAAFEDKAAENPRLQADLDLKDAELDLQETMVKRAEAQERLNHLNDVGVEGTDAVVAARRRLEDAERDLAEATDESARAAKQAARDIKEAKQSVADAARDSERQQVLSGRHIIDAEEAVTAATEALAAAAEQGMGAAAAAANRYEAALADLAPAQRQFVEFLVSLRPLIRSIRDETSAELLPGVEESIRRVLPLVDDLRPVLRGTATGLSDIAREASLLVSSPAWRTDLVRIGQGNIDILRSFGAASLSTLDSARILAVGVQPLTQRLADMGARIAELVHQELEAKRASGDLDMFFGRVGDRVEKLILTTGFLGTALLGIFKDATPAGDSYLDSLVHISARLDLIVERARDSGKIKAFFEEGKPAAKELGQLLGAVVDALFNVGRANFGTFIDASKAVRTELLPALEKLFAEAGGGIESIIGLATKGVELLDVFVVGNPAVRLFTDTLTELLGIIRFLSEDVPVLSPLLVAAVGGLIALKGALALIKLVEFATGLTGVIGLMERLGASEAAVARVSALGGALSRFGLYAGLVIATKVAFDQINQTLDKYIDKITKSATPTAAFADTLRRVNNVFPELKGNTEVQIALFAQVAEKSAATAQRIVDDMRKQGKETGAYEDVLQRTIDAQARHGIAEDDVTRKVQEATDKLRGKNTELDRYLDKLRQTTERLLSQSNAEIASRDAMDRLTRAVQENGINFDINTAKGRENLRARNDLIGALGNEVGQLEQAALKGQLDVAAKDSLIARLRELSTSAYPEVAAEAQAFLTRLHSIKDNSPYTAELRLDASQARVALHDLVRDILALEPTLSLGTAVHEAALERRAGGGRVVARTAYIVGEHRPEVFVPDVPGTILPEVRRPEMTIAAGAMPQGPVVPSATFPTHSTVTYSSVVNYHAPLVAIDATFGPGSAAADIVEAMRGMAREEIAKVLAEVLARVGAGTGDR